MEKNTEALKALRDAAIARDQANLNVEKAVAAARAAGSSWADVAMPLGITRQAAQQKYSASSPELIAAHRAEDRAAVARYDAANQDTTPATPSIFLAPELPAPAADQESQNRADFWESKRRYAVTECGAIYAPEGEHGWKLESRGRAMDYPDTYPGMAELLHDFDGVLWIDREHRAGLVQNAAVSRETWLVVAANDDKNRSVSAHRELSKEIDEMREQFIKINAQLKAHRTRKATK